MCSIGYNRKWCCGLCDYNLETRSYNKSFSRTLEDLDHHNINSIIDDLVEYDTWQERKSKK